MAELLIAITDLKYGEEDDNGVLQPKVIEAGTEIHSQFDQKTIDHLRKIGSIASPLEAIGQGVNADTVVAKLQARIAELEAKEAGTTPEDPSTSGAVHPDTASTTGSSFTPTA